MWIYNNKSTLIEHVSISECFLTANFPQEDLFNLYPSPYCIWRKSVLRTVKLFPKVTELLNDKNRPKTQI